MTDAIHPLRKAALDDREALAARYPGIFAPSLWSRLQPIAIVGGLVAVFIYGLVALDVQPGRIITGIGKLGEFIWFMLPPSTDTWAKFWIYMHALGETVAIAFLGTFTAAILALPVGFLAAKNIVPNIVVHFASRRFLDTIRCVDELIWALIWVSVVGLGPFAGVLALICSNFGLFAKLFSEAIEAADRKASEGVATPAAARCTQSASASCRRSCRSSAARCSTSSRATPARRPSSALSGPAASACISPSRSGCWSISTSRR